MFEAMLNPAEFRAMLDKLGGGVSCRERIALHLLYAYKTLPGLEFDARYPTFVELACECYLDGDGCSCTEEAIIKWGLRLP